MRRNVTLMNDFHNTRVTIRVPEDGVLTKNQVSRVRRVLCGMQDCLCGGNLSERGEQEVEIDPLGDGRARLTTKN